MKFKVGDNVLVDNDELGVVVAVDFSDYFCYLVDISGESYWCIEDSLKAPI